MVKKTFKKSKTGLHFGVEDLTLSKPWLTFFVIEDGLREKYEQLNVKNSQRQIK